MERVEESARLAVADQDIQRMPMGYTSLCPAPLEPDHLLLKSIDGKGDGYGKEEIFGRGCHPAVVSDRG